MKEENLTKNFNSNLNYILTNLEKDILKANSLEDKMYLEISKSKIIEYLNYVYQNIKSWKQIYNEKKYENILNKYKKIESIISQLEFCLADYEDKFHMDGISYSIFEIGKILSNMININEKKEK